MASGCWDARLTCETISRTRHLSRNRQLRQRGKLLFSAAEKLQPNLGNLPASVEPGASSNQTPGDVFPTDGARKLAEAALPDTPAENGNHGRKEQREDSAKNDPTKSNQTDEEMPIKRKDSRNHVAKVAQLGNFQEPEAGN